MIPWRIDLILRLGRILGTGRSLYVQLVDLVQFMYETDTEIPLQDVGPEF